MMSLDQSGLKGVDGRALPPGVPRRGALPMVELVVLACLLKDPQHCEAFHLPFQQETQLVQCVWQSQMQAAQWSGEHPEWVIRRVSCEMPQT
jgi:hypothetical protein